MSYVIICTSTGTMLAAENCVIVPDSAFSEEEWDGMDDRSDSEIAAFGRERGRPVLADSRALDAVAALLNAEQWSSDHLSAVADMVRATGRTIEDVQ